MSHVTPAHRAASDTESGPSTAPSTLRKYAPVLITENQVAFSTAAAAPAGSTRRWWLGRLGRILTALTQPRPLYPHRELAYLEAGRMSRAMDRL
jgi:hypothetical protein